MSWQPFPIREWKEFLNIATAMSEMADAFRDAYIFRGQAESSWTLQPTLLRTLQPEVNCERALHIENRLQAMFLARAHLYTSGHIARTMQDKGDCWSLMQHYGAPTRLLDWTRSPFVAAYFACAGHPDKDGAVWLVHVNGLNERLGGPETIANGKCDDQFFSEQTVPRLRAISIHTEFDRMVAQQGVFTACSNVLSDHADVISNHSADMSGGKAMKLTIANGLKTQFLRQLRAMNITAASLFPGLEGLGRSLTDIAGLAAREQDHKGRN